MSHQSTEAYQLGYRDGINGTASSSPFKKNNEDKKHREYLSGYDAGKAVAAKIKMGSSPNMR